MSHVNSSRPRWANETTLLVGVTLLAAILRFYQLGAKSLWLDEAVVYGIAQRELVAVVRANAEGNSGPPLFALMLHFVSRVGRSEAALRAMSAVAATAAVPTLYVLARGWMRVRAATVVALLAACAPSQVEMGQEVREYAIAMMLATVLLLLARRLWERPTWRDIAAWALVGSLSIWTQYGLALLLAMLGVFIFVRFVWVSALRCWIPAWGVAQVVIACAVVAVYVVSLRYQFRIGGFGADNQSSYLIAGYWNGTIGSLVNLAGRGTYTILRFGYPRPLMLLPLLAFGMWACVHNRHKRLPLLLFIVMFGGMFAASLARLYPYQGGHQIVLLMPMLYVMVGLGFDAFRSLVRWRWASPVVGTLLVVNGLVWTVAYLQAPGKEELRPVVAALTADLRPGDTVYVYYGALPAFRYYYQAQQASVVAGEESRSDPAAYMHHLAPLLERRERLWMVFSHCYADECERIVDSVRTVRRVDTRTTAPGASLYIVP